MLNITPVNGQAEITHIVCPNCKEKWSIQYSSVDG